MLKWAHSAKRHLILVLLTIAAVWFVVVRIAHSQRALEVVSAPAVVGDIETVVLATGIVQAFKQVSVGAQASGQLKSLKVSLGESVKSGTLIAEIDPMTEQNALLNAQAALSAVRAQRLAQEATLTQAELEFARQQAMLAQEATPRATFELAEATLSVTRANITALDAQIVQAQSTVDTAKLNLGYTKINAPMDGDVVAIITQQGQTVNANQLAPTIIKLARLDVVTIKAQISEADVVRVKPGQEVYFTILGEPDHRYAATLRAVEPAPDSINSDGSAGSSSGSSGSNGAANSAVYYNGLFDVENNDKKLRISMTAQVNVVIAEAKHVLMVPSAALSPMGKGNLVTVQVLDPQGRGVRRTVTVGINNNVNAQILSGLSEGERVIIGTADATVEAAAHRAMRM
jgi:macrolide-specific efflux system membrane fusion protein